MKHVRPVPSTKRHITFAIMLDFETCQKNSVYRIVTKRQLLICTSKWNALTMLY